MREDLANTKTILVIDDEEIMRETLSDFLRDEGFQVDVASSGEEGLELAKAEPYDCAIVSLLVSYLEGRRIVVVGYRVAGWFGMKFDYCTWVDHRGATMAYIPHPSGRNRLWNYPVVVHRVKAFLAEVRRDAEAEDG